ncbi:MAG: ABC transporter substrate-binding protein [Vicinamibacterales bacterium]
MNRNRFSRRTILRGAGATGAMASLAALSMSCGDDDDAGSSTTSAESTSTRPAVPAGVTATSGDSFKVAAKQELVVRQYDEPTGFDPAVLFRIETENVAYNLYSGLTAFDPKSGAPIPDLAKSWEVSADGKSYKFNLVDNAFFHQDFGKMTSADVKYSYERILDPATKSTYAIEFSNIKSIEAPDPLTVVINLKAPDVNFLYQVGNYHQGQIVSKAAIEKFGKDYPRNPIGTGPFALKTWTANQQMVLEGHGGYYKGKPTLTKLTLNLVKDVTAAETALNNGEVAVAMNMGSTTELVDRLSKAGKFQLIKSEDYANSVIIFNPDHAPLADKRVRQAYAYGYDQKAIFDKLTPYTTKPGYSILPSFMPVYTDDLPKYTYQPDKAKALLKEAGFGGGVTIKEIVSNAAGGPPAQSLLRQAMLAEVGIKLEFDLMETAVWLKRRSSGDYNTVGRLNPAVNPDTLLFGYLHPDQITPKGINGAKYNNPQVTQLLESARAEQEETKRKAMYAQIQKTALEDLPYLPNGTSTVIWAAYPWVRNLVVNKLATVDYFPVKIEEHA